MTDPNQSLPPAVIESLLRDTNPYLSCDECFDQLDTYVEQLLQNPHHQDPRMQVHLSACTVCADEADALRELLLDHAD